MKHFNYSQTDVCTVLNCLSKHFKGLLTYLAHTLSPKTNSNPICSIITIANTGKWLEVDPRDQRNIAYRTWYFSCMLSDNNNNNAFFKTINFPPLSKKQWRRFLFFLIQFNSFFISDCGLHKSTCHLNGKLSIRNYQFLYMKTRISHSIVDLFSHCHLKKTIFRFIF